MEYVDINAVANSIMLQLHLHYFYNIIFYIKYIYPQSQI